MAVLSITGFPYLISNAHLFYYHWIHTAAGGLCVTYGIIHLVVSVLTLGWFIRCKMKNKKYHTVGTVPKYHTVGTVPKYHTVGTVPKYHTVGTVPKYPTVGTVPKYQTVGTVPKYHCRNSSKIPHCRNSSKIPNCRNSSKIKYQNRRKRQNRYH